LIDIEQLCASSRGQVAEPAGCLCAKRTEQKSGEGTRKTKKKTGETTILRVLGGTGGKISPLVTPSGREVPLFPSQERAGKHERNDGKTNLVGHDGKNAFFGPKKEDAKSLQCEELPGYQSALRAPKRSTKIETVRSLLSIFLAVSPLVLHAQKSGSQPPRELW
jgi:hypothetical protein